MPTQIFQISRAPEAPPLTAERLRHLLWKDRVDTEWEVRDVLFFRDEYKAALERIQKWVNSRSNVQDMKEAIRQECEQALAGKEEG